MFACEFCNSFFVVHNVQFKYWIWLLFFALRRFPKKTHKIRIYRKATRRSLSVSFWCSLFYITVMIINIEQNKTPEDELAFDISLLRQVDFLFNVCFISPLSFCNIWAVMLLKIQCYLHHYRTKINCALWWYSRSQISLYLKRNS